MKRQLVFLAFFGLLPLATTAQAEFVLDMSFGTHGIVTNPTAYKVTALAIQQDGKILTVEKNYFGSQRFLIRRNQDGSLDTSFGENGSRMITVEGQNAAHLEITDILIRPDEKIIACGRYNAGQHTTRTLLIQYNSDGTVDEAFHARPLRCTGRERYTLQSDRKIVSVKYSGADVILRM